MSGSLAKARSRQVQAAEHSRQGRRKLRSRTAANALLELDWSLIGLWLIPLYTVREQIKLDSPPEQSSVGLALDIVQEAMRNWNGTICSRNDFRRRLGHARKDGYQRNGC